MRVLLGPAPAGFVRFDEKLKMADEQFGFNNIVAEAVCQQLH